MSIAQEHFASSLLRGRLLGLARGWGSGGSPLALLACVPGDQHDLGLICFGLALRAPRLAHRVPRGRHAAGHARARRRASFGRRSSSLTATTPDFAARPPGRDSPRRPARLRSRSRAPASSPEARRGVGARAPRGRSRDRGRARRARRRGLLMPRPDLTGWSSTERVSPGGRRAVRAARDAVAPARGALGGRRARSSRERYWSEVERTTRRLVRAAPAAAARSRCGCSAAGRCSASERPQTVVDDAGVLSRFPITGGALARTPRRLDHVRADRDAGRPAARDDRWLLPAPGRPPGRPAWTGGLYRHVQQRIHTSISRRYFRRLIGEEPA